MIFRVLKRPGFSLLEIILVITIIGLTAGVGTPIYLSYQTKNNLDIKSDIVSQGWREAQLLAESGKNDADWGVEVASGQVVIFSGPDYAGRDGAADIIFPTASNISAAGLTEIIFQKFSGAPDNTGALTLTAPDGATRTLTINAAGAIDY